MKATRIFFLFAVVAMALSSCDKFKEKRFSTTIPYDFVVEIPADGSTVVDLTGDVTSMINKELEKVKDKIKRYELVSVDYKIWEFYGASPNTFSGSVGFGNANATSAGLTYEFNGIDLQVNSDNPDRVKMNLNSQDIANIQQYFMDTNGLKMFFKGDVDQAPCHFIMQIVVNIDAIAEVKK
ncbi:MAG: hypothetical protein K1X54_02395 [Flavobacteriales bacterium]|nr:hypothetical protein [Flavobacteriales bacterium]